MKQPEKLSHRKPGLSARAADFLTSLVSHWFHRKDYETLRKGGSGYSIKAFNEHRCIFVHIPKAAGVSINQALFGNLGGGHVTIRAYKRIFGPSRFNSYFKFTIVRNPYSRLLSAYRFLKAGGFDEKDRNWADHNLKNIDSFDQFVDEWLNEESVWSYMHFRPQYSFVCDLSLNPEVDFIGKIETLENDFNQICSRLNIDRDLKALNRGGSDNTDWVAAYSSESLEKVYRLYKLDFRIFGYKK